jgi:hypothetical protein
VAGGLEDGLLLRMAGDGGKHHVVELAPVEGIAPAAQDAMRAYDILDSANFELGAWKV